MTFLLGVAYAAVAALLLNLGLKSGWSAGVKAGAVVVVSLLYGGTYLGIRSLEGWPTRAPTPEEFRLYWVTVEEPRKGGDGTGGPGAIYFWVRELDEAGRPTGAPRSHVVAYDEALAREARRALEALEGGRPVNGLVRQVEVLPERAAAESGLNDDEDERVESRPSFEFREVPPPELPRKAPL